MKIFIKKNLKTFWFCMTLLIMSCSNNLSDDTIKVDDNEVLNIENFISYEDILNKAGDIYKITSKKFPSDGIETRSNLLVDEFSSKNIKKISSFNDRKGVVAMYAVNFEKGGFIVLSADKRAPEVLAFSEDQSFEKKVFEMSEEMPYGITIWIENIQNSISAFRYDSFKYEDNKTNNNYNITTYSNEINVPAANTPYLLTTTWGQANGYNDSLVYCNAPQKMLAGCATVAIAQILKYHGYPNVYNWSAMYNNAATPETARLYKEIVNISNATPNGCSSTSTTFPHWGQATLAYFGFTNTDNYFNCNAIKTDISNNRPVLIYGNGHAWVCDGYCLVETETTLNGRIMTMYSDYLHNNWGWYGSYDGWFIEGMTWNVGSYSYPVNTRYMIYNMSRIYTYPYTYYL